MKTNKTHQQTYRRGANAMAAALLLTMTAVTQAADVRPGQAGVDAMREQAMAQIRGDMLAGLKPRVERDLVAAVRSAAPRNEVASGMPVNPPARSNAAP
jgi:hypothetical protein